MFFFNTCPWAGVSILPAAAIALCPCLHFCSSRKLAIQSKVRRGNGFQGFPNQLDYGLYFFGCGDECQKYTDGEDNVHFSRDKDTLVYVHGWEVDRVGQLYRETFNWKKNEPRYGLDVDLARAWLENGWNVAVFYWAAWRDPCCHAVQLRLLLEHVDVTRDLWMVWD